MDTFWKVSVGSVVLRQPLYVVLLKRLDMDISLKASVGSVVLSQDPDMTDPTKMSVWTVVLLQYLDRQIPSSCS